MKHFLSHLGIDFLRYVGFLVAATLFIVFLMTLIAYPFQVIAALVIGIPLLLMLNFFLELGR